MKSAFVVVTHVLVDCPSLIAIRRKLFVATIRVVKPFRLKASVKRFHWRVIPAISGSGEALTQAQTFQVVLELLACVNAPAITMKDGVMTAVLALNKAQRGVFFVNKNVPVSS